VFPTAYPYLADVKILADGGYAGAPHDIKTPVPQPEQGQPALTEDIRTYNRILRGLRFQGERAFALLFGRWKALRHVTMSPRRIGDLMCAALVLAQREHKITWQIVGEITSVPAPEPLPGVRVPIPARPRSGRSSCKEVVTRGGSTTTARRPPRPIRAWWPLPAQR